jgi:hypothetical protein
MRRGFFLISLLAIFAIASGWAQTFAPAVTIVLPPRLLANSPATLAVLGADGHLAPGVAVDIGSGQRITTDATGRASFIAPAAGAFIATASGVSAGSLVDAPQPASPSPTTAPAVSQHDRFAICGSGFDGNVAKDAVTINGDPAFMLAASAECLVVLPQSRTLDGPAKIEIDAAGAHATASTALVALDFLPPNPPLLPGRKGRLFVRAAGTADPLRVVVENHSPGVIRFLRGDTQELRTSGGAQNEIPVQVQAIRSGDFSFHARLLAPPDPAGAVRYLQIAEGIAPKPAANELKAIATQLERHPRDSQKSRQAIDRIARALAPGALRTLLESAAAAL